MHNFNKDLLKIAAAVLAVLAGVGLVGHFNIPVITKLLLSNKAAAFLTI